ncbi:UNVERIFIED_ORG: hypothetical protein LHJ69_19750 [Shinella sp. XGS7]|nr:hypothetical protein [Shinella sp. XGS7]
MKPLAPLILCSIFVSSLPCSAATFALNPAQSYVEMETARWQWSVREQEGSAVVGWTPVFDRVRYQLSGTLAYTLNPPSPDGVQALSLDTVDLQHSSGVEIDAPAGSLWRYDRAAGVISDGRLHLRQAAAVQEQGPAGFEPADGLTGLCYCAVIQPLPPAPLLLSGSFSGYLRDAALDLRYTSWSWRFDISPLASLHKHLVLPSDWPVGMPASHYYDYFQAELMPQTPAWMASGRPIEAVLRGAPVSAVPEPEAAALWLSGLLVLLIRRPRSLQA